MLSRRRNKVKKVFCIVVGLVLLLACKEKTHTFRDLKEFSIDTTSIRDRELVQIIYFSGGPDYNEKKEYYYHYVVVTDSLHDTVNVLCSYIVETNNSNRKKIFLSNSSSSSLSIEKLAKPFIKINQCLA